jgi:hypothetical protein
MCLLVKALVDTLLLANHSPQSNQTPVVKEILSLSLYHPAAFKKEPDKNNSSYKSASVSEDLASDFESNPASAKYSVARG